TGTAGSPIIFRGVNNPTFTGQVTISGSYVIVDGISVINGGIIRLTGDHVELRNSEASGNNAANSRTVVAASNATDVVIYKNKIHDNGDWLSTVESDYLGIGGSSPIDRIWVIENESYHNAGDSLQFGHAQKNGINHAYIGRNHFHDDRENAVDIKEASNVIISENTFHGYRATSSSLGEAIVSHYCQIDLQVLYNNLYDSQVGLSETSLLSDCLSRAGVSVNMRFIGNVIHDIIGSGIQGWGSGKKVEVVNNTLYNIGGNGIDLDNLFTGSLIENNILSAITGQDTSFIGGTPTVRNNLPDTSNPLFVNAGGSDFHLQSNSPAINTGITSTVYNDFLTQYGISISYDKDHATRPVGSAWDMGAYEFGGTVTPPPTNQVPVGSFDEIRLSDGVIRAWSYDPDATAVSNQVNIYINGAAGAGGTLLSGSATNVLRPDVNSSFGITGNHGVEFTIPAQYRDALSHSVYVYGIDTSSSSISTLLTGSPKTFTLSSTTPLVGDINLDHIVNSIDYSILNSDWFTSNARSDLNHDGIVNAIDYSMLNANWFKTW
ncbi:MAG: hypothetical protein KW788_04930, partial [Candidatus Doudnabacteria bacterium]|nr:hypothetical protein [Candidatus Doudnabacteria bacterium]